MELVQALENGVPASAPLQGQNWPDFNHRLRLIYGDGVAVPGLDLAADPANLGGMTIQTSA